MRNAAETEFALWGIPAGESDALHARVLTLTTSPDHLEAVKAIASRDGWHSFTVQAMAAPDFARCIR